MNPPRKEIAVRNDLRELDALAEGVVNFCRGNGVSKQGTQDIRLAVEEAVSNTIKYGYPDRAVHLIYVRVEVRDPEVLVEIEDDGNAFNPLDLPDPDVSLPVADKPVGGLGIYLMKTVMDRVEYKRAGGKNIVLLTKTR